jgi:hypothetical protein
MMFLPMNESATMSHVNNVWPLPMFFKGLFACLRQGNNLGGG